MSDVEHESYKTKEEKKENKKHHIYRFNTTNVCNYGRRLRVLECCPVEVLCT